MSIAILPLYEFIITFEQEVAVVWARDKKLSLGSILLVSTRWCMVLSAAFFCLPGTKTVRNRLSRHSPTRTDSIVLQRYVCHVLGVASCL